VPVDGAVALTRLRAATKDRQVSVVIPERTVDAWAAIELARRFPRALIWAPTQRQLPDYDLQVGVGKLSVFEDKAPAITPTHPPAYRISINQRQLYNYLIQPFTRSRTFYVLPCPPAPPGAVPPPGARVVWRLAPSCRDWFKVVSAKRLWTELWGRPLPPLHAPWWRSDRIPPPVPVPRPRSRGVDPCDRDHLRRLHALTLDEFLTCVDECEMLRSLRFRGSGEKPSRTGDLPPSEYDYAKELTRPTRYDRTLAAFVPAADLRGWPA
jgi:hypothetical protein